MDALAPTPETALDQGRVTAVAERLLNLGLAGSVLWWTGLSLQMATAWAPVHVAIAGLNLTVAVLLATRESEQRAAAWTDIGLCLPAVVSGGLALKLAADPTAWPLIAQMMFIIGSVGAVGSLLALGKSFSVMPGVRSIVETGPYALVRHPAYAAQFLMILACSIVVSGPWGIALAVASFATLAVRINVEERLLLKEPQYAAYAARVTSRFVPGLW